MQVILLEQISRLGQMGDEVTVKPGFARNYLLPQGKALRANNANRKVFEEQRVQLEARNLELKKEAQAVSKKLEGKKFVTIRQAGDTGQLYGSVTTRDITEIVTQNGFSIMRSQVILDRPIKLLGLHDLRLSLHPEVEVSVIINVARTKEEAERQARGEDITAMDDSYMDEEEDELLDAGDELLEDDEHAEQAETEVLEEDKDGEQKATESDEQPK